MVVKEVMTKVMMVLDLREEVAKQSFAAVWALVIGIWQEQVHNGINIIIVGNEIARQGIALYKPLASCPFLLFEELRAFTGDDEQAEQRH